MPRLCWFFIWVVFLSLSAGSCLHVLCNLFRNLTWFLHIILCVIFVYGTHMGVRVCVHMCGRKPEAGIGYFPLSISTCDLRWSPLEPVSLLNACMWQIPLPAEASLSGVGHLNQLYVYSHYKWVCSHCKPVFRTLFNLQNWFLLLLTCPALLLGVRIWTCDFMHARQNRTRNIETRCNCCWWCFESTG